MHKLAGKAETQIGVREPARERERKGEWAIEKKRMNKRACEQRSHIHMYIHSTHTYVHIYLGYVC